jgi:predicted methyltransferase
MISQERITTVAHDAIVACLCPGDFAIDATAGNGKDTLLLSRLVGPTGRVFAFDIQPTALARTAEVIHAAGIGNVELLQCNHAEMRQAIPAEYHGRISAVVLNLGYLPGSDPAIVTHATSTCAAIDAAADLLRDGGLLSVIVYPSHPGGSEEMEAVQSMILQWREVGWEVHETESWPGPRVGPHLWVVRKPIGVQAV